MTASLRAAVAIACGWLPGELTGCRTAHYSYSRVARRHCGKNNPANPLNSFPLPRISGASTRSLTGIDSGGVVTRISTRSTRVLTLGGVEC